MVKPIRPISPGTSARPNTRRGVTAAGAISIGRNIGSLPMPRGRWSRFITATEAVVRRHGGVVYTVAYGVGEWDGVMEETVVVTFDQADMTAVTSDLSRLAARYGQEAIAFLHGHTMLIYRNEPKPKEAIISEPAS